MKPDIVNIVSITTNLKQGVLGIGTEFVMNGRSVGEFDWFHRQFIHIVFYPQTLVFGLAFWFKNKFASSGQDFNSLKMLWPELSLREDCYWNLAGTIIEEKVVAVVDRVLIGLVVEGTDAVGLHPTGGRSLVVCALLEKPINEAVAKAEGNNSSHLGIDPNVLDAPFLWSISLTFYEQLLHKFIFANKLQTQTVSK